MSLGHRIGVALGAIAAMLAAFLAADPTVPHMTEIAALAAACAAGSTYLQYAYPAGGDVSQPQPPPSSPP